MTQSVHTCRVLPEDAGVRLDKFLSTALSHLSRARVQQLIEQGHVVSGGQVMASASKKTKAGEEYQILEPEIKALDLTPAHIALTVVFEDEHLLVIDKPAGMTVHPAPGAGTQTLVHALLAHCGDSLSGIGGVARPGIVHRIDKDTSGLLVVAKTDAAHQSLSNQLRARTLKRTYLCYVWGALNPRTGIVDAPMARHKQRRKQMAVMEDGKHAVTHYETAVVYRAKGSITPFVSKVFCQLETGRTHQIRVHMAHMKCPMIGDKTYGLTSPMRTNRLRSGGIVIPQETQILLNDFPRQALHAFELALTHPFSGEEMRFSAQIPADLQALEQGLVTLTNQA
jgi:23S rRNA pseudouridine1911/1915/1917 synthase